MTRRAGVLLVGDVGAGRTVYANALCYSLVGSEGIGKGLPLDFGTMQAVNRTVWELQHGRWLAPTPRWESFEDSVQVQPDGPPWGEPDSESTPKARTWAYYVYQSALRRKRLLLPGYRSTGGVIVELTDCAGETWRALAEEMFGGLEARTQASLLARTMGADAVIAVIDAGEIRSDSRTIQRRVGDLVTLIDVMQSRRQRDRRVPLPVAVVLSKADLENRGALDAAVAMLRGDDPPRMAGREEAFQESLSHLSYLVRRLASVTKDVNGFAISSLEAFREFGVLTDAQATALDPNFKPNGRGLDLEAPLRWCLHRARILRSS